MMNATHAVYVKYTRTFLMDQNAIQEDVILEKSYYLYVRFNALIYFASWIKIFQAFYKM